jgi:hypothetical protein
VRRPPYRRLQQPGIARGVIGRRPTPELEPERAERIGSALAAFPVGLYLGAMIGAFVGSFGRPEMVHAGLFGGAVLGAALCAILGWRFGVRFLEAIFPF